MLGPSFVSGGQQVFEFVRMMAHNQVYLRCAQLANASRVLGNLGDDILSKITWLGERRQAQEGQRHLDDVSRLTEAVHRQVPQLRYARAERRSVERAAGEVAQQ